MTPILTKTETATVNGRTVKIIGEVYPDPIIKTELTQNYTVIKIQNEAGIELHPSFSFAAMLTEEQLTNTVNYLKSEMTEKPEEFFPQLKKA